LNIVAPPEPHDHGETLQTSSSPALIVYITGPVMAYGLDGAGQHSTASKPIRASAGIDVDGPGLEEQR
jgi:hypothetical protein